LDRSNLLVGPGIIENSHTLPLLHAIGI
jgi:hypothetical protein